MKTGKKNDIGSVNLQWHLWSQKVPLIHWQIINPLSTYFIPFQNVPKFMLVKHTLRTELPILCCEIYIIILMITWDMFWEDTHIQTKSVSKQIKQKKIFSVVQTLVTSESIEPRPWVCWKCYHPKQDWQRLGKLPLKYLISFGILMQRETPIKY